MDVCGDVWGQIALEANQMYVDEGGKPFANTVIIKKKSHLINYLKKTVCQYEIIVYDYK